MWDRMLAFLGFEEEQEGEEEEGVVSSVPAAVPATARHETRRRPPVRASRGVFADEPAPVAGRTPPRGGGATVTRIAGPALGIVVSAPKRFEEAQEVADHLKGGQPVVLHLDGMERDLAQRLINFLAGSVYALGGEMHRVGSVVLFAPSGVEVTLPIALRIAERDGR